MEKFFLKFILFFKVTSNNFEQTKTCIDKGSVLWFIS